MTRHGWRQQTAQGGETPGSLDDRSAVEAVGERSPETLVVEGRPRWKADVVHPEGRHRQNLGVGLGELVESWEDEKLVLAGAPCIHCGSRFEKPDRDRSHIAP